MKFRHPLPETLGLPRIWWATAIGGAVALAVIALLPMDSIPRSLVARSVGIAALVLFFAAFIKLPQPARQIWVWVGAFLGITVIADVLFDYQALVLNVRPFPGITDVLYLAAFVCAITGLVKLSGRLNPCTGLPAWIDIAIMVIAVSACTGVFVFGSIWTVNDGLQLSTVLDLLYPLLSVVLLTALVRLFVLPHPRNTSITLFLVSGICFFLCDLIFSNQLIVGRTPVVLIEVLWAAALICLPLALLSPGASHLVPVDATLANDVSPTRQILICICAIAVPALVLIELVLSGTVIANWLMPVCLIVVALVLLRLHLLLRASQAQASELSALGGIDALTGLPNKGTWEQLVLTQATRQRRSGGVCTIAKLDIDDFAKYRDPKAPQRGDLLLISASLAWLAELGSEDLLARTGRDEFAIMICRETLSDAQEVLRRVLRATPSELTVSVGAAILRPEEQAGDAEQRATSALRAAMPKASDIDEEQSLSR